jgi:hypothetical protein
MPQSRVTATESQNSYAMSDDEQDESAYQESERDDLASDDDGTASQTTAGAPSTECEEQAEDEDGDSAADTGPDVCRDSSDTSNVSTSLTTWSSASKNPFRNAGATPMKGERGCAASAKFAQSVWDEPLISFD